MFSLQPEFHVLKKPDICTYTIIHYVSFAELSAYEATRVSPGKQRRVSISSYPIISLAEMIAKCAKFPYFETPAEDLDTLRTCFLSYRDCGPVNVKPDGPKRRTLLKPSTSDRKRRLLRFNTAAKHALIRYTYTVHFRH